MEIVKPEFTESQKAQLSAAQATLAELDTIYRRHLEEQQTRAERARSLEDHRREMDCWHMLKGEWQKVREPIVAAMAQLWSAFEHEAGFTVMLTLDEAERLRGSFKDMIA